MIDATEGEREGIWNRLRRRKVVQWGIAYAAAAWGLLQGAQFLAEIFEWSSRALQLGTVAALIGLPIVLVIAWYHGDRGQQQVSGTELAIVALLFLVGGGLFWRYHSESDTQPLAAAVEQSEPAATPALAAVAPDEKSIAVLPFVDMSPAKDQEYMSDGIAEELLNLLAKAPDLKVIARTSSFAFKGKDVDVAEIARKLNVAHLLEGSVRKSGDTIRVTAQLIRTADSTHLWSETYDRPLDDIFAVQDEIASAIVQALQIQLTGGTLSRQKGGTQNLEAYQLFLRAWNGEDWNSRSSIDAAGEYLEQAIKLDPGYGMAWLGLASAASLKADHGFLDAREGFERARQLALHALQLSPDLADAHARLQYIHLAFDWDWQASEREGRRALAIDPTNARAMMAAGVLSYTLGRWDDAERQLRAALVRDPLNPYVSLNLGTAYYLAGRFEEAEGVFRTLLEVDPGFPWIRESLGKVLLAQGKPEAALAMVQQEADERDRLALLPVALQAAGRTDEADEALKAQIVQWADTGASLVARSYAYRGDKDLALEWLDRAYKQKDPSLVGIVGEPLFSSLVDDPRYKAFLRRMNLPEG